MAIAPEAYRLPFRAGFTAPVGAVLECLGMQGWRYRDPHTGADTIFKDLQANSYARHTGGMVGTFWTVVDVQPAALKEDGSLVTLEAAGFEVAPENGSGAGVRLRKVAGL